MLKIFFDCMRHAEKYARTDVWERWELGNVFCCYS